MTAAVARGRLFAPGLPGAGVPVEARWQGDSLLLKTDAAHLDIAATQLRLEASGFNLAQLQLAWQNEAGPCSCVLDAQAGIDTFLAQAPLVVQAQRQTAGRKQRRMQAGFRMALGVYGLIFAMPFVLLLAFLFNIDRIAGWAVEKVPPRYEARLGDMVLAQTRATGRMIENGPALEAVKSIGTRLTEGSVYSYRWFVVDEPAINAFAAPGGVIVVHSGLIAATGSAEELAGVLAHEVAHVEQRHSLRNLAKKAGFSVLMALVLGDWSGGALGGWAGSLTELKFSRDAEIDADREGLRRLVRAGIDPQPMATFFGRLAEKEKMPQALSILASHPPSQERMQALQRQIATLPAQAYRPLEFDWNQVKASLPRPGKAAESGRPSQSNHSGHAR